MKAIEATPAADTRRDPLAINCELVEPILVGFVRSEVRRVGFSKAVLGLSGGIDSTLSAYIAAKALGPENPETAAARELVAHRQVRVTKDDRRPDGLRLLEGKVESKENAVLLDGDGRILRGQCNCSHHFTSKLRRGPCRHLQALRNAALGGTAMTSIERWFDALWN